MSKREPEVPEFITASELPDRMREVLNAVEFRGLRYVVTRNGEPCAELVPLSKPAKP